MKLEMTFIEFIQWTLDNARFIKTFEIVDDQDTYQTVEFAMVPSKIVTIIIFF